MFLREMDRKKRKEGDAGLRFFSVRTVGWSRTHGREGSSAHKCALSFPGVKSVFRCGDLPSEKHGSQEFCGSLILRASRRLRSVNDPKL